MFVAPSSQLTLAGADPGGGGEGVNWVDSPYNANSLFEHSLIYLKKPFL